MEIQTVQLTSKKNLEDLLLVVFYIKIVARVAFQHNYGMKIAAHIKIKMENS